MDITTEDIESITTSVWETMLDEEVHASGAASGAANDGALTPSHVGHIRFEGAFNGLVSLHFEEPLLRGAASVMFGVSADEVNDSHMVDTVAELTNMVGGNIKCLLEQPTKLSLPTVVPPEKASEGVEGEAGHISIEFRGRRGGLAVHFYQLSA